MAGRFVSHYEILGELGRGGSGIVYQARDVRLGRLVALKFLSPHLLNSAEGVARFLEEARAISALNHPNIATLYDVGEQEGARFLVLEYLPGGTLRARLHDLRAAGLHFSMEDIGQYALQVCDGLAHAHQHGIVHRDVKSGNVMFSESGTVKLTDFGLAKSQRGPGMTSPGMIVGTVAYMSPEQAQGLEADERSDIFSLGVMLYEMAAGALPFQGAHEVAILRAVIEEPTPSLAGLRPDLPEAFRELVTRATAKQPEDRFQSVEELARALRKVCGVSEGALGSVRVAPMPLGEVTLPARGRRAAHPRLWQRRWFQMAALPVAGALAALGLLSPVRDGLGDWLWPRTLPQQKLVAVMPFTNIGGQPTEQAFCDGLTVTLTARLNQLEQTQKSLRVVPATEVRSEKALTVREARRRFGVNLALTGGVERTFGRTRVTLSLVDAVRIRALASHTVNGALVNAADVEEGVFRHAVEMLGLAPPPPAETAPGRAAVPGAYDLYLQGRGYLHRYDAVQSLDNAIRVFQQALQQDPKYAPAYAGLGEACSRKYRRTKDPQWVEEGRRSATRAVELNSRLGPAYLALGMVHSDTGRYEEAVEQFQRALRLNPADSATFRELARAHAAKGQSKEAIQCFQKAVDLWPENWTGYTYLGEFYSRSGRDEDAERCFRRAVELEPDSAVAHRNLGAIYLKLGRLAEAERATERSLALQPTAQASSNLGMVYEFMGRYAEAVRMHEQAVAAGSNDRRVWGNLAESYRWSSGPAGKAAEAYRQALQLAERDLSVNPRDAETRAFLAVYCLGLSQRTRALREIAEALRLAPNNKNVLFQSALVYEMSGSRARALQALKSALERGYSIAEVQWHPDLASLRQDPRYRAVLAAAGMPPSGLKAR